MRARASACSSRDGLSQPPQRPPQPRHRPAASSHRRTDEQGFGAPTRKCREHGVDVAGGAGVENVDLHPRANGSRRPRSAPLARLSFIGGSRYPTRWGYLPWNRLFQNAGVEMCNACAIPSLPPALDTRSRVSTASWVLARPSAPPGPKVSSFHAVTVSSRACSSDARRTSPAPAGPRC